MWPGPPAGWDPLGVDDADVIEQRFWAIAREIGPIRPAPLAATPCRASVAGVAFFLATGPLAAAAVAWGVVAVALGL